MTIVAEDAETFVYPPAQFDLVWTMESSEHFADKWAYFQNVARTLRAGGRLLLAAWTTTTASPRLREIARRFVCPELWTAEQYRKAIEAAGLRVRACEDLSDRVARTWEICRERAQTAGFAVKLLPVAVQEFVAGIDVMREAYRSGELTYTVIAAEKP